MTRNSTPGSVRLNRSGRTRPPKPDRCHEKRRKRHLPIRRSPSGPCLPGAGSGGPVSHRHHSHRLQPVSHLHQMDHRAGAAALHRLRQLHRNLRRRARLERCQGDDLFQRREPCPGAGAGSGDRDLFQPRLQGKRARSGHLHHPLRRDAGGRGPDLADHAEPRDRGPELSSHERRPPPEPLGQRASIW